MNIKTLSKTVFSAFTIISLSVLLPFMVAKSASAAQLNIEVSNIHNNQGKILVALYQNQQDYQQDKNAKYLQVDANAQGVQLAFNDLPEGSYAIKLFHDENKNNKLDFNMLGIPKESYGFSNNVGRFGQPAFDEAKFMIKQDTKIAIKFF